MCKTSTQYEDVEEFMKTENFREVRFLDHVDESPDAVEDTPDKQHEKSFKFDAAINISDEENDDPAHEKVKKRVKNPWNVIYEHFRNDSEKCDTPDDKKNDVSLASLKNTETHGCVASRNKHIDHTVIELLQSLYSFFATIITMIDSACKV